MSGFAVNGNIAELAIETQSAAGSPASNPAYSHQLFSGRAKPVAAYSTIDVTDTSNALPMVWKNQQNGQLDAVVVPFPGSIGKYLKGILPTDTKTGTSDPYLHTFTPGGTDVWSTLFGTMPASLFERFDDTVISSITFAFGDDKLLQTTISAFAKTSTRLATTYTPVAAEIVAPTSEFFHSNGATFKFTVGATPATDTVDNVRSGSITIARPVTIVPTADTFQAVYFNKSRLNVTADLNFVFKDWGMYNETFYGGVSGTTPSADVPSCSLDFTFPCLNSVTHSIQIQMPWLQLQADPPDPNTDGSELMLHAVASGIRPTSGNIVTVLLKNSLATAY